MRRFWQISHDLAPSLCLSLVLKLLSNPLLISPTIKATLIAVKISDEYYLNAHSKGIGNAFKHAFWSLILVKNTTKFVSEEKAVQWAKTITDLHEKCVKNKEMDWMMDLHNNRVGRNLFPIAKSHKYEDLSDFVALVQSKAKTAALVNHKIFFSNYPYDLVYVK